MIHHIETGDRFMTVITNLHVPPDEKDTRGWDFKSCYDSSKKITVNGHVMQERVTVWIFESTPLPPGFTRGKLIVESPTDE